MNTLTKDFLEVQRFSYRLLGLDIVGGNGWLRPCATLWTLFALIVALPTVLVFIVQKVEIEHILSDGVSEFLIDLLGLFKFGLIIWLRKNFEQLVAKLRDMLSKECENEITASIINEENQREQRLCGFYANCFLLTGALSVSMPTINTVVFYLQTGNIELQWTFPCVFPWDNNQIHYYLFSYGLIATAAFAVVVSTICVDTLFIGLSHNLVALFKTVKYKMQFFVANALEENQARLGEILKLYENILDMSDALNRHFRLIICMQFVVASVLLCMLSYTLSENLAQPQMVFYAAFTLSVLIQLYIYCYSGEYLKTESREFARAIYDSPWYEASMLNPAIGRSLQISLMRAQRGSRIDGYFFEANMMVFLSIVRTAMSYLALLRSIS